MDPIQRAKPAAVTAAAGAKKPVAPTQDQLEQAMYKASLKKPTFVSPSSLHGTMAKWYASDKSSHGAGCGKPFAFEYKGEKYVGYQYEDGRDDSGTIIAKLNDKTGTIVVNDRLRC